MNCIYIVTALKMNMGDQSSGANRIVKRMDAAHLQQSHNMASMSSAPAYDPTELPRNVEVGIALF